MEIVSKKYNLIFWSIISFILIIMLFKWIDYLIENDYIIECFRGGTFSEASVGATSHTVNLPLTTTYSCKNFCGPNNVCAITGEQCTSDYDCTGCENIPKRKPPNVEPYYRELSSNNDIMDSVYVGSNNNLVPSYYSGDNKWIKSFNEQIKMYNEKETYNNPLTDFEQKMISVYPSNVSMTGQYYETTAPSYNS